MQIGIAIDNSHSLFYRLKKNFNIKDINKVKDFMNRVIGDANKKDTNSFDRIKRNAQNYFENKSNASIVNAVKNLSVGSIVNPRGTDNSGMTSKMNIFNLAKTKEFVALKDFLQSSGKKEYSKDNKDVKLEDKKVC